MKKILKHLSAFSFSVMPATALFFCSWDNPGQYNYPNRAVPVNIRPTDTVPKNKQDEFKAAEIEKAMEAVNESMANLNEQMKNIDIKIDKQVQESLAKINFEKIGEQVEASLKEINWDKMQKDINISIKNAQEEIAKIDFSELQNQMKAVQEKLQSEEFKSQFDAEKLQQQINESMHSAKASIEKAKREMEEIRDFTDALSAEGLIDRKKGYNIEWKNGNLYINGKEQPKDISDKYRKYEHNGEIRMRPENSESF